MFFDYFIKCLCFKRWQTCFTLRHLFAASETVTKELTYLYKYVDQALVQRTFYKSDFCIFCLKLPKDSKTILELIFRRAKPQIHSGVRFECAIIRKRITFQIFR